MEIMDYRSLTRRQLQTLCKKHGIPANGSNASMADALVRMLQKTQEQVICKEAAVVTEDLPNEDGDGKSSRKVRGRASARSFCKVSDNVEEKIAKTDEEKMPTQKVEEKCSPRKTRASRDDGRKELCLEGFNAKDKDTDERNLTGKASENVDYSIELKNEAEKFLVEECADSEAGHGFTPKVLEAFQARQKSQKKVKGNSRDEAKDNGALAVAEKFNTVIGTVCDTSEIKERNGRKLRSKGKAEFTVARGNTENMLVFSKECMDGEALDVKRNGEFQNFSANETTRSAGRFTEVGSGNRKCLKPDACTKPQGEINHTKLEMPSLQPASTEEKSFDDEEKQSEGTGCQIEQKSERKLRGRSRKGKESANYTVCQVKTPLKIVESTQRNLTENSHIESHSEVQIKAKIESEKLNKSRKNLERGNMSEENVHGLQTQTDETICSRKLRGKQVIVEPQKGVMKVKETESRAVLEEESVTEAEDIELEKKKSLRQLKGRACNRQNRETKSEVKVETIREPEAEADAEAEAKAEVELEAETQAEDVESEKRKPLRQSKGMARNRQSREGKLEVKVETGRHSEAEAEAETEAGKEAEKHRDPEVDTDVNAGATVIEIVETAADKLMSEGNSAMLENSMESGQLKATKRKQSKNSKGKTCRRAAGKLEQEAVASAEQEDINDAQKIEVKAERRAGSAYAKSGSDTKEDLQSVETLNTAEENAEHQGREEKAADSLPAHGILLEKKKKSQRQLKRAARKDTDEKVDAEAEGIVLDKSPQKSGKIVTAESVTSQKNMDATKNLRENNWRERSTMQVEEEAKASNTGMKESNKNGIFCSNVQLNHFQKNEEKGERRKVRAYKNSRNISEEEDFPFVKKNQDGTDSAEKENGRTENIVCIKNKIADASENQKGLLAPTNSSENILCLDAEGMSSVSIPEISKPNVGKSRRAKLAPLAGHLSGTASSSLQIHPKIPLQENHCSIDIGINHTEAEINFCNDSAKIACDINPIPSVHNGSSTLELENASTEALNNPPSKKDEKFMEGSASTKEGSPSMPDPSTIIDAKSSELSNEIAVVIESVVSTNVEVLGASPRETQFTDSKFTIEPKCEEECKEQSSKEALESSPKGSLQEIANEGIWEERLDDEENDLNIIEAAVPSDCLMANLAKVDKQQHISATQELHYPENIKENIVALDEDGLDKCIKSLHCRLTSESEPMQISGNALQESPAFASMESTSIQNSPNTLIQNSPNKLKEEVCFDDEQNLDEAKVGFEKPMPLNLGIDTLDKLYEGANNAIADVSISDVAKTEDNGEAHILCSCMKYKICDSIPSEAEIHNEKLLPINQLETTTSTISEAIPHRSANIIKEEVCFSGETTMENIKHSESYLMIDDAKVESDILLPAGDPQENIADRMGVIPSREASEIASAVEDFRTDSEMQLIMKGRQISTVEPSVSFLAFSSPQGKEEEEYMLEEKDELEAEKSQPAAFSMQSSDSGDLHDMRESITWTEPTHIELGEDHLAIQDDKGNNSFVSCQTVHEGVPFTKSEELNESVQLSGTSPMTSIELEEVKQDRFLAKISQVDEHSADYLECNNDSILEITAKQMPIEKFQGSDLLVSKFHHRTFTDEHALEGFINSDTKLLQALEDSTFSLKDETSTVDISSVGGIEVQEASKLLQEDMQDLHEDSAFSLKDETMTVETFVGDIEVQEASKLWQEDMQDLHENGVNSNIESISSRADVPRKNILPGVEIKFVSNNCKLSYCSLGDLSSDALGVADEKFQGINVSHNLPQPTIINASVKTTGNGFCPEMVAAYPATKMVEGLKGGDEWSLTPHGKEICPDQIKEENEQSVLQSFDGSSVDKMLSVSTSSLECSDWEAFTVQPFSNEHLKTSVDCIQATVGSIMAVPDKSTRCIQLKRLALQKAENSIDAVVQTLAETYKIPGFGRGSSQSKLGDDNLQIKGMTKELLHRKLNSVIKEEIKSNHVFVASAEGTTVDGKRTPIDGIECSSKVVEGIANQEITSQLEDVYISNSCYKVDPLKPIIPDEIPVTDSELLEEACEDDQMKQDSTDYKNEAVLDLDSGAVEEFAVTVNSDDSESTRNLLTNHTIALAAADVLSDEDNTFLSTAVFSHFVPDTESNVLKQCQKELHDSLDRSSFSQVHSLSRADSNLREDAKTFFSTALHQDKAMTPTSTNKLDSASSVEPSSGATKNEPNPRHINSVQFHGKENKVKDHDLSKLCLQDFQVLYKEKTQKFKSADGRKIVEKELHRIPLTPVHANIKRVESHHLSETYKN